MMEENNEQSEATKAVEGFDMALSAGIVRIELERRLNAHCLGRHICLVQPCARRMKGASVV